MARVVHEDWIRFYHFLPEGRELGGQTGRGASLGNSKKQRVERKEREARRIEARTG